MTACDHRPLNTHGVFGHSKKHARSILNQPPHGIPDSRTPISAGAHLHIVRRGPSWSQRAQIPQTPPKRRLGGCFRETKTIQRKRPSFRRQPTLPIRHRNPGRKNSPRIRLHRGRPDQDGCLAQNRILVLTNAPFTVCQKVLVWAKEPKTPEEAETTRNKAPNRKNGLQKQKEKTEMQKQPTTANKMPKTRVTSPARRRLATGVSLAGGKTGEGPARRRFCSDGSGLWGDEWKKQRPSRQPFHHKKRQHPHDSHFL